MKSDKNNLDNKDTSRHVIWSDEIITALVLESKKGTENTVPKMKNKTFYIIIKMPSFTVETNISLKLFHKNNNYNLNESFMRKSK